ncbi:MAG: ribosome silencing factor [Odoribacteraceae bacterium]|jgi:ribosome-associated protein|nr:ribosome silencing factor [Odoribacteraceae bacterium]
MDEAEQIASQAIRALDDRKGVDIVRVDLRGIMNCFCSFFVICHGTSGQHVAGLADHVRETVQDALGEKPAHVEGMNQATWVLLDYGSTVVHVFQREQREYYQLEEFWADAGITKIEENTPIYYGRK